MIFSLRLLACAIALLYSLLAGWSPETSAGNAENQQIAHGVFYPMTFRKVHLVRPDLIPYPVACDVYC